MKLPAIYTQGIIDWTGTETRPILVLYGCNGNKIKKLLTSTLNRIAASFKGVFLRHSF